MRLTIRIDDRLFEKFKTISTREDVSMNFIIHEFLEAFCDDVGVVCN